MGESRETTFNIRERMSGEIKAIVKTFKNKRSLAPGTIYHRAN